MNLTFGLAVSCGSKSRVVDGFSPIILYYMFDRASNHLDMTYPTYSNALLISDGFCYCTHVNL